MMAVPWGARAARTLLLVPIFPVLSSGSDPGWKSTDCSEGSQGASNDCQGHTREGH